MCGGGGGGGVSECVCVFLQLLNNNKTLVRQRRKGASEVKWLKTVLSSGTLSDKMAALTLLVQVYTACV